jgi:hypothetical protein
VKGYRARFGDMDANGDGSVSWPEFRACFPMAEPIVFGAADLNKDNRIDPDEWRRFGDAHGLKPD